MQYKVMCVLASVLLYAILYSKKIQEVLSSYLQTLHSLPVSSVLVRMLGITEI